jgi:hypothetical protein
MIDPSAIAQGILAGIATRRVEKPVNDTIDDIVGIEQPLTVEQTLYDILEVLIKIYEIEKKNDTDEEDLFYHLEVNTATTGSPFVFRHKSGKQRFAVLSLVAVILDLNAPGLGQLVKTIPADTWVWFMYPENTTISLDTGNTFTQLNLWIRETNETI